ncbi:MAG TPA: TolC family protein [Candidatus Acidoferrum sp.]|nr:TolC family protein [Candidatus Acidoferrum sp.]
MSDNRKADPNSMQPGTAAWMRSVSGRIAVQGLIWICLLAPAACGAETYVGTNVFTTAPLSIADTINIALRQNPNVVRAQKDVEAAAGVAVQSRAIAIPKVRAAGSYSAVQSTDIDTPNIPGFNFTFGTEQAWASQIRVVQSLYEGGRILSGLRVARLTKERSLLSYQTVVADTVLAVELAYFDVLLAQQEIIVQERSVELLNNELSDTKRRYEAGTVPQFNVLRATVEVANQEPKLIRARNDYRISKNVLANALGFNIPKDTLEDIPLHLSDKLEAEPYKVDLSQAIVLALERRTELGVLRKTEALRYEDIVNARAGYLPSVQAYGGYDLHSSMFTSDLTYDVYGWTAGVQVGWDIFDGFLTKGKVMQARAEYAKAAVDLDDTTRRIELDVRTAYSKFIEATDLLASQQKVVEQATEALRLASARYDAGTGTQLDVLSARTALTDADTTQVEALHDYAAARARLERAVGLNIPPKKGLP